MSNKKDIRGTILEPDNSPLSGLMLESPAAAGADRNIKIANVFADRVAGLIAPPFIARQGEDIGIFNQTKSSIAVNNRPGDKKGLHIGKYVVALESAGYQRGGVLPWQPIGNGATRVIVYPRSSAVVIGYRFWFVVKDTNFSAPPFVITSYRLGVDVRGGVAAPVLVPEIASYDQYTLSFINDFNGSNFLYLPSFRDTMEESNPNPTTAIGSKYAVLQYEAAQQNIQLLAPDGFAASKTPGVTDTNMEIKVTPGNPATDMSMVLEWPGVFTGTITGTDLATFAANLSVAVGGAGVVLATAVDLTLTAAAFGDGFVASGVGGNTTVAYTAFPWSPPLSTGLPALPLSSTGILPLGARIFNIPQGDEFRITVEPIAFGTRAAKEVLDFLASVAAKNTA